MTSRIIVTGKNRNFSVLGMPALLGGASRRAEGSFDQSSELPANSGVPPASEATAEPSCSFLPQPEAAPAVSGTRLAVCPDCMCAGYDYDFYICPLEHITKKEKVPCRYCNGECAVEVPL